MKANICRRAVGCLGEILITLLLMEKLGPVYVIHISSCNDKMTHNNVYIYKYIYMITSNNAYIHVNIYICIHEQKNKCPQCLIDNSLIGINFILKGFSIKTTSFARSLYYKVVNRLLKYSFDKNPPTNIPPNVQGKPHQRATCSSRVSCNRLT